MTHAFAPKPQLVQPNLPNYFGGGIATSYNGAGTPIISAVGDRPGVVQGLSDVGTSAANTFGDLYNTVKPGFNDLLSARLNTFNDAARSAIGDLSQNLATRRILGSSFGQDTLTRGRAELARQRDNIVADNFLKSLEAQRQLTADKFKAGISALQPRLDELNLEAGLAQTLGLQASKALADAAQFNAKAQTASNVSGLNALGSVIGTVGGLAFGGRNPFGSAFSGGGGGGGDFMTGSGSSLGGSGFSFDGAPIDASSVMFV